MLSGGPFKRTGIISIVNALLAFFVTRIVTSDSSYCILCIHYPIFANFHILDGARRYIRPSMMLDCWIASLIGLRHDDPGNEDGRLEM